MLRLVRTLALPFLSHPKHLILGFVFRASNLYPILNCHSRTPAHHCSPPSNSNLKKHIKKSLTRDIRCTIIAMYSKINSYQRKSLSSFVWSIVHESCNQRNRMIYISFFIQEEVSFLNFFQESRGGGMCGFPLTHCENDQ